jgi:hypothetical protein
MILGLLVYAGPREHTSQSFLAHRIISMPTIHNTKMFALQSGFESAVSSVVEEPFSSFPVV